MPFTGSGPPFGNFGVKNDRGKKKKELKDLVIDCPIVWHEALLVPAGGLDEEFQNERETILSRKG